MFGDKTLFYAHQTSLFLVCLIDSSKEMGIKHDIFVTVFHKKKVLLLDFSTTLFHLLNLEDFLCQNDFLFIRSRLNDL